MQIETVQADTKALSSLLTVIEIHIQATIADLAAAGEGTENPTAVLARHSVQYSGQNQSTLRNEHDEAKSHRPSPLQSHQWGA